MYSKAKKKEKSNENILIQLAHLELIQFNQRFDTINVFCHPKILCVRHVKKLTKQIKNSLFINRTTVQCDIYFSNGISMCITSFASFLPCQNENVS